MSAVSPYSPKAYTTTGGSPANWYSVKGYLTNGGAPQLAKKVSIRNATNDAWVDIWDAKPIIVTNTPTSANYDPSTQLTFTGTVDTLGFSTTVYVMYKRTSNSVWNETTSITLGASLGPQSYSFNVRPLTENINWNWAVIAYSDAGTSASGGIVATNLNCNTGASGWNLDSETNTAISTGCTCGSFNRNVKTYSKIGCTTYSVTTDGSCAEQPCGCATASTNGWSATQTRYRDVACDGYCVYEPQAQSFITKTGCTEVADSWTYIGSCTSRMEEMSPFIYFGTVYTAVPHLYGTLGTRWVVADFGERGFAQYAWIDAGSRCYCNGWRPSCNYRTEYTLVRCTVTGAVYWSDQLCS